MDKFTISDKYQILAKIIIIFIVPVSFLRLEIIPRKYYLAVLAIFTCLVFILIIKERWTLKDLNIRIDNLQKAAIPYSIFTTIGVLALIIIATIIGKEKIPLNLYFLFLGWSLPIGLIQEFLYRGFLIHELRRATASLTVIILASASIFAFLHILYEPALLILPLTFLAGAAFTWMYLKYPNILLISLSHGILNFVAIWYGFF